MSATWDQIHSTATPDCSHLPTLSNWCVQVDSNHRRSVRIAAFTARCRCRWSHTHMADSRGVEPPCPRGHATVFETACQPYVAGLSILAEAPRLERGQPCGFGRIATCWFRHSPTLPFGPRGGIRTHRSSDFEPDAFASFATRGKLGRGGGIRTLSVRRRQLLRLVAGPVRRRPHISIFQRTKVKAPAVGRGLRLLRF